MNKNKDIIENEINACAESLERMWDMGVIRNPKGKILSTTDFVAELFSKGTQAAIYCLPFMAGAEELRKKEKERDEFLEKELSKDSLYDGHYHALDCFDRNLSKMRDNVMREFSLEADIEHYQSYSGIDKIYPRDFSAFMELRNLDYDASYEVSEKKRIAEEKVYAGLTSREVSYHISMTNCPNAIGNLLSRGDSLPTIFVQAILTHAAHVQIYCNEQELKKEIMSFDMRKPFINENVDLPGKWVKIAKEEAGLSQRDVYKLPERIKQQEEKAPIPIVDEPKNQALHEIRVMELSAKILGPNI
jgi:hypothetical protein